jgi:hypothetical protein
MHVAAGQPSSGRSIPFTPVGLGLVSTFSKFHGVDMGSRMIAEHSQAPPASQSPPVVPLRI